MGNSARSRKCARYRLRRKRTRAKGFQSVNLLSGFVKPGGDALGNLRLSPEFDLKFELTNGRVNALTKTDCLAWHDSGTSERTSCFIIICRNISSGIYKNWVFAQPVKDWSIGSSKSDYVYLESLMGMGLVADVGGGFPTVLGGGLSVVLLRFGTI